MCGCGSCSVEEGEETGRSGSRDEGVLEAAALEENVQEDGHYGSSSEDDSSGGRSGPRPRNSPVPSCPSVSPAPPPQRPTRPPRPTRPAPPEKKTEAAQELSNPLPDSTSPAPSGENLPLTGPPPLYEPRNGNVSPSLRPPVPRPPRPVPPRPSLPKTQPTASGNSPNLSVKGAADQQAPSGSKQSSEPPTAKPVPPRPSRPPPPRK